MLINPRTAIKEGWITFPKNYTEQQIEKCIQPNAIDFTVDKIFDIDTNTKFIIDERNKSMRNNIEKPCTSDGFFCLDLNTVYDGLSDFYVNIPINVAAMLITRSTFSRNGVFITSGLYDSKYQGHIGFAIHNKIGESLIGQGTRIGQIMFISSPGSGEYTGSYNHIEGTHWAD